MDSRFLFRIIELSAKVCWKLLNQHIKRSVGSFLNTYFKGDPTAWLFFFELEALWTQAPELHSFINFSAALHLKYLAFKYWLVSSTVLHARERLTTEPASHGVNVYVQPIHINLCLTNEFHCIYMIIYHSKLLIFVCYGGKDPQKPYSEFLC